MSISGEAVPLYVSLWSGGALLCESLVRRFLFMSISGKAVPLYVSLWSGGAHLCESLVRRCPFMFVSGEPAAAGDPRLGQRPYITYHKVSGQYRCFYAQLCTLEVKGFSTAVTLHLSWTDEFPTTNIGLLVLLSLSHSISDGSGAMEGATVGR